MSVRELPPEEIQMQIDQISWYHEFDFGNGLVAKDKTSNAATHRKLWTFIQTELDRLDFDGRTVLDIGCWDGFWSFYAERRGASGILATDDSSQNWAGDSGFHLARDLLGSKVEWDTHRSIYDLSEIGRTFDVVLCLGVYYRIIDPVYAFAQMRHCCHDETVVVFEGDLIEGVPEESAFYSRDVLKSPRFVPGIEALRMMINAAYFTIESEAKLDMATAPAAGGVAVNRVLLTCRPMTGENPCYLYPPPFGLAQYDSRFGGQPARTSATPLRMPGNYVRPAEPTTLPASLVRIASTVKKRAPASMQPMLRGVWQKLNTRR